MVWSEGLSSRASQAKRGLACVDDHHGEVDRGVSRRASEAHAITTQKIPARLARWSKNREKRRVCATKCWEFSLRNGGTPKNGRPDRPTPKDFRILPPTPTGARRLRSAHLWGNLSFVDAHRPTRRVIPAANSACRPTFVRFLPLGFAPPPEHPPMLNTNRATVFVLATRSRTPRNK